jgi:hypothetical protein
MMDEIDDRWGGKEPKCDKCGKITTDLSNWDFSWPNFNFDFCSDCSKDEKACFEFYYEKAKPYIKLQQEYWSRQNGTVGN